MNNRQQWLLVFAVLGALALVATVSTFLFRDELVRLNVGARAPEFSGHTLDATPEQRSLADYAGRVVVLNVWRTDCPPCVQEMPSLERLHREFRDRGLSVVAVSVDVPGSEQLIRDFVAEHGLTFDVLFDPAHSIKRLYQTKGEPETFVISRSGVITRKEFGARRWDSLDNRALMAQLLGEPWQPPPEGAADTVAMREGR